MQTRITAAAAATLTLLAGHAIADVLTVGPSLATYDFLTITAAIAGAASGDEIVVHPGIYPENLVVTSKDLTIRNEGGGDVTVYGQNLGRCLLVTGTGSDVDVRGLTFTGGREVVGGGVSVNQTCSIVIRDCVIDGNTATDFAGGMYVSGRGTLINVIIRNNTATNLAGGMVTYGSEASPSTLVDCLFENNSAPRGGGYVYYKAGIQASLTSCIFRGNQASQYGGAVANYGTSAFGDLRMDDCLFEGNWAGVSGGAIWVTDQDITRVVNSIFLNNTADASGGAVYNEQTFDATNCTFVGNAATAAGVNDTFQSQRADADTNLLNCIVVNDSAGSEAGPGDLNARYSLIPEAASSTADSLGNFNADPLFIDVASGDLHLSAGSAAIDAGNSLGSLGIVSITALVYDFDGGDRNVDDPDTANTGVPAWALNIDVGAFEYQPDPAPACPADLNNDGSLDFFDVQMYLNLYSAGCP